MGVAQVVNAVQEVLIANQKNVNPLNNELAKNGKSAVDVLAGYEQIIKQELQRNYDAGPKIAEEQQQKSTFGMKNR